MQPTDREHRVIETLHRIAVFCDTRIGWNRIGIALSAVILAVGGAVRYRIYSGWGLTAADVAKLCFIAGLTFWLGNATVLGLGTLYAPLAASAIDQLPPWLNRAGAFAILAVLAFYVHWVWQRPRI